MSMKTRLIVIVVIVAGIFAGLILSRPPEKTSEIKAAFDAEFLTRPDGYPGLSKYYNFTFPSQPLQMDPGLMYKAVVEGSVDVIDGFATDGRIPAYDLFVLKDDKGFFPPYYAAPVIRGETLKKYPEIKQILGQLSGKISDGTMQKLNYEVDEKGRKAEEVARDFLLKHYLISPESKSGEGPQGSITIGGKHFTEQEIIGQMMALLIEEKSDVRVVRKLNLGGTMICFNALISGDIDIYAEYTGTGLVNILKQDVIPGPQKAYEVVKTAFEEKYNLIWLEHFGFNNTYTLTMRKNHAKEMEIQTISDLAKYIRGTK